MAVSDTQKIDLLFKKLFGVSKTDTATNKSPSNESILSPQLNRGDKIWTRSTEIPLIAAQISGITQSYQGTSRVQCVADTTSNPINGVYPTWKTQLADWIPPEFGSGYFVKVYVDSSGAVNPASTGTQLFDSGTAGVGEWHFDYQAGILNFIGNTIPSSLTTNKVIMVMGYRYVGEVGLKTVYGGTF